MSRHNYKIPLLTVHQGLSIVLDHLSDLAYTLPKATNNDLVFRILLGEVETLRGSIEMAPLLNPVASMACIHVKVLVERHNPSTTSDFKQMSSLVKTLANMLLKNAGLMTPLTHHFVGLSAVTLMKLMDVAETKVEAQQGLLDLQKAMQQYRPPSLSAPKNGVQGGNRTWLLAIADKVNKKLHQPVQPAPTDTDTTTTESGGLEGLAEVAAVRHGETTGGNVTATDWRKLTKAGYLKIFA